MNQRRKNPFVSLIECFRSSHKQILFALVRPIVDSLSTLSVVWQLWATTWHNRRHCSDTELLIAHHPLTHQSLLLLGPMYLFLMCTQFVPAFPPPWSYCFISWIHYTTLSRWGLLIVGVCGYNTESVEWIKPSQEEISARFRSKTTIVTEIFYIFPN